MSKCSPDSTPLINVALSEQQYLRRFANRGFRKDLKAHEWKFISYRIEKRKKSGKDSIIKFKGTKVPTARVRKEISRYGRQGYRMWGEDSTPNARLLVINMFQELKIWLGLLCSPKTPEGVEVSTASSQVMTRNIGNLPWIQSLSWNGVSPFSFDLELVALTKARCISHQH